MFYTLIIIMDIWTESTPVKYQHLSGMIYRVRLKLSRLLYPASFGHVSPLIFGVYMLSFRKNNRWSRSGARCGRTALTRGALMALWIIHGPLHTAAIRHPPSETLTCESLCDQRLCHLHFASDALERLITFLKNKFKSLHRHHLLSLKKSV